MALSLSLSILYSACPFACLSVPSRQDENSWLRICFVLASSEAVGSNLAAQNNLVVCIARARLSAGSCGGCLCEVVCPASACVPVTKRSRPNVARQRRKETNLTQRHGYRSRLRTAITGILCVALIVCATQTKKGGMRPWG